MIFTIEALLNEENEKNSWVEYVEATTSSPKIFENNVVHSDGNEKVKSHKINFPERH